MAIWGGAGAAGLVIGVLLGGVLTDANRNKRNEFGKCVSSTARKAHS